MGQSSPAEQVSPEQREAESIAASTGALPNLQKAFSVLSDPQTNSIPIHSLQIQKTGSVGRSIDVSGFKNYEELRSEIERMFGLEGLLNDTQGSSCRLVYVDFDNDVLLVGDDPWEEFVGCVRCIRIISPTEVQKIGEEGMQLLNSAGLQGINGLIQVIYESSQ